MTNIQRLNSHDHATIGITADTSEHENAIYSPIVVQEFRRLQSCFPLLFTKPSDGSAYQPVALFGLQAEENLFIKNNSWLSTHVPLLIERGPLLIATESASSNGRDPENFVAINCDHTTVSSTAGERLFNDDGSNTKYLNRLTNTLTQIHAGVAKTSEFVALLTKHELISPLTLRIPLTKGKAAELQGLYAIDDEKLQNASDRTLIDLHKNSCLLPSYMMIASMGEVARLIELKNLKIEQDCEF